MLRIELPYSHESERRYIVDVLLREFLGLEIQLEISDRADVSVSDGHGRELILSDQLFATSTRDWLTPASLPIIPLKRWRLPESLRHANLMTDELPVIYGGDPTVGDLVQISPDRIRLDLDVFGAAFFMLTRDEEVMNSKWDRHDRFAATSSLAFREGFLGRPIVNEYVEVLWELLRMLWPSLRRKNRAYSVHLSHDVDTPLWTLRRGLFRIGKSLVADVLTRREFELAGRRICACFESRLGRFENDPNDTFDFLMEEAESHGRRNAFYFIASQRDYDPDHTYTVDHPWLQQLFAKIHRRGHEIGLHGSLVSYDRPAMIREEFGRLRQATVKQKTDDSQWGGRQHYLRWRNPVTWQAWEDAGLAYDSTLTFADHCGFRCGVCYEYPVFNLTTRKPLKLRERPLIVMEASVFYYQKMSAEVGAEKILEMASVCRKYNGMMTLLWHNDQLVSRNQREFFHTLCRQL